MHATDHSKPCETLPPGPPCICMGGRGPPAGLNPEGPGGPGIILPGGPIGRFIGWPGCPGAGWNGAPGGGLWNPGGGCWKGGALMAGFEVVIKENESLTKFSFHDI
jgi:hypothetical protein